MIKGTTRLCGLIGNPVEHSISPLIHNTIAEKMGIDMVYTTFKVEDDQVDSAIEGAYALNILGGNVTVPHKQAVMNKLVEIDPMAQKIGAVNTFVRVEGGYKGYNTDIIGFERELIDAGIEVEGRDVVMLGAGGAARAILFWCASKKPSKIYLYNRNVDKARELADEVKQSFDCEIMVDSINNASETKAENYLAIQTTSVGLYPKVDDVVVEADTFYSNAVAGVDIVYNPANTMFMRKLQQFNKPAYNGLKMLLYQGVAAFELINHVEVSKDITELVYDKMKEAMGIVG